jgi:hypothetical protein
MAQIVDSVFMKHEDIKQELFISDEKVMVLSLPCGTCGCLGTHDSIFAGSLIWSSGPVPIPGVYC